MLGMVARRRRNEEEIVEESVQKFYQRRDEYTLGVKVMARRGDVI